MLTCKLQGLGENIHGTALGTINTFTHDSHGEACNDDITRTRRQEFSEGMAKIQGQGQPPRQSMQFTQQIVLHHAAFGV
jgi:hypothetical protein